MLVKKGARVTIVYKGTFDDGTVFDRSKKALEFEIGAGKFLESFEKALIGMKKGEEKEIRLLPSKAFGEFDSKLIRIIPRDQISIDKKLCIGLFLPMRKPNGKKVLARIIKISEDNITLDSNHPLAGITLNYKIKVLDISTLISWLF